MSYERIEGNELVQVVVDESGEVVTHAHEGKLVELFFDDDSNTLLVYEKEALTGIYPREHVISARRVLADITIVE